MGLPQTRNQRIAKVRAALSDVTIPIDNDIDILIQSIASKSRIHRYHEVELKWIDSIVLPVCML